MISGTVSLSSDSAVLPNLVAGSPGESWGVDLQNGALVFSFGDASGDWLTLRCLVGASAALSSMPRTLSAACPGGVQLSLSWVDLNASIQNRDITAPSASTVAAKDMRDANGNGALTFQLDIPTMTLPASALMPTDAGNETTVQLSVTNLAGTQTFSDVTDCPSGGYL